MKRSVRINHAIGENIQIVSQSLEILPGKRKLILLLKIIPVCLLDCVSLIILSILRESNSSFYELDYRALLIIVTTLLSVFFLKYQYYKHHMFGISLILIGIIIFTVIETKIKNSQDEYFLFCCSLNNSNMYGYLIETKYVSPFMMVAFEGIVGFICTSIMFIPLNYIPCGEKLENGKYDENL